MKQYLKTDPFLTPSFYETNDGVLPGAKHHQEVTETFLVGNVPALWLGKIVSTSRYRLFWLFFLLVFTLLIGRLAYLQLFKGEAFSLLAEGNRSRLETILPPRGIIFDYLGVPLVDNIPTFSLFLNSGELAANPDETEQIAKIILAKELLEPGELTTLLESKSYLPVVLKENIDYETALSLELALKDLKALKIVVDPQRFYKANLGLAHVLGYLSRITAAEKDFYLRKGYQLTEKVGESGLEEYYQDTLRGQSGNRQIEVDSSGREKKIIAAAAPLAGKNLFLALDAGLQEAAIKALRAKAPHQGGSVIALDPKTGKIKAFVSWPAYDSNAFSQGIKQADYQALLNDPLHPLFNRAIAGEYPSGSTIKIIMSSAGLEEAVINRFTSVVSTGGIRIDKWFFPDWKIGGHGLTNVIKALAESVNTFYYYLALETLDGHQGLGLDKMLKYFKLFGLGEKLGIDLNGERSGFLPDPDWKAEVKNEVWYPGDTLHLAIGQGDLLVTPLQVAAYTSVIASGGILYQPQLVEKIVDAETSETTEIKSKILKQDFLSQETVKIVAEGLRSAVTSGSARWLDSLAVPIAGKTGTAQAGTDKLPHAWFSGYLPYNDPQLVITVLIENGGEGSSVAVPIARDILEWYIANRLSENN